MPQPLNLLNLRMSLFLQKPSKQKFPTLQQLCKQSRLQKSRHSRNKPRRVWNSDPAKVRDITL